MKKLLSHLFVFIAFCALITLGTWQILRLQQKEELIDRVTNNLKMLPLESLDNVKIPDDEFRKVRIVGRFIHEKEIFLAKGQKGHQGFHIIVPFVTEQGDHYLVNRGWVPQYKREHDRRPDTLGKEMQQIDAIIRGVASKNWLTLENNLEMNFWYWVDVPAIKQQINVDISDNYYLVLASDTESNKIPIPASYKPYFRNDHLQYAITWYSLAVILLLMFLFRRRL